MWNSDILLLTLCDSGRLQALDLLKAIFLKFPVELVESQAELFYLQVVLQVMNDSSKFCRAAAADAIKCLLGRVEGRCRDKLATLTLEWLRCDNSNLR